MCLAHSKHSVNITFHPCFTYSSLQPSRMPCSSCLVPFLPWYINLDWPNIPIPTPSHLSTPNGKPIPVSSSWKYRNNLYVSFFWLSLYLYRCRSCILTTFQGKWVGVGDRITCTPLCSLLSACRCPLAKCVPNKQLMKEERFGS